ncbi:MAG: DEAD/DEAH box helicase family protein, partial [bacterium]
RQLEKGMRVRVSFNHQSLIGYVMGSRYTSMSEAEIEETFGYPFKWIQEVIDEKSVLNEELMDLAEKMARLTLSPRIACYQAMLPPTLKPASVRIVKKKTQKAVRIIKEGTPVTKVQKQLYEELQKKGPQLIKDLPYSASPIKGLLQQGLIEVYDQEIQRDPYLEDYQEHHVTLTSEQNAVVQAIEESDDCISLLHGVTGSGKTEVYLALSDHVLAKGRNVIMLVPEISLTPMIVKRFKDRFHEDVAVLHSRLSDGEKYDE